VVTTHSKTARRDQSLKDDEWMGWDRKTLFAAEALFHFPPSLAAAYGDFAGYDLSSETSLIKYTIDFVNRPHRKVTPEQIKLGVILPRGREALRQILRVAVHGPSAPGEPDLRNPSDEFIIDIRHRAAKGIAWKHRLERTPTGAQWRHHAFIQDADAFYALLATLLMSEEHRREFGQCKHCDRFFLVQKREQHDGRPERLYCCKEHRSATHAKGGAARQRDRRTRLKAGNLLKGHPSAANMVTDVFRDHPDATAEQLASYAKTRAARKHK
jgi:hypothetical protein